MSPAFRASARLLFVAAAATLAFSGGANAAAVAAGKVDTAAAAKVISDYRASHGLPPVKIEAHLMSIAAIHSERMASADQLDHVLPGEGSFPARMTAGGYEPMVAAEDIGAGYKSLAEVMAAWEKSPEHNANLLRRDVSEIGIALYTTPAGIYNEYWSLVLAAPMPPPEQRASGGSFVGGPRITLGPFLFGR